MSFLKRIMAMAMDAADGETALPPDLVAHDAKYHHGHWSGKGKCKYREDRAAAIAAMKEGETEKDIIDRLTPEDVDGEEIDKADAEITGEEKRHTTDISKLEGLLPKFKGVAASILNGYIAKRKSDDIQPLLTSMSNAVSWAADNNGENNGKFDDTMHKLADLLKSGALNEMLGLGKVPAGVATASSASRATVDPKRAQELNAEKDGLVKHGDLIRQKMQLASPMLAALLQTQLDEMDKRIGAIDAELSGKKSTKKSEKEIAKEKKDAEKAAKKKAVAESKVGQNGAAQGVALDSVSDVSAGKTSVLNSSDFKSMIAGLPESQKIFALSDFHDAGVKGIDPDGCGTVICAGDFTKHGATSHSKNIGMDDAVKTGNEWLKKKFFKWCDKNKGKEVVLVAGNHDHFLGDSSADNIQWPSNVKYLKDSEAIVNGMRIYGTPWCEKRKGSAKTASMTSAVARQPFEIDDDEIKAKFDKIPVGLDVLVVHQTPLFDYKDEKGNDIGPDVAFVGGGMKHCGSAALTEAIKRAKPKLVICGHLHDGDHRPYKIGDTVVVNGAYVANRGDPSWTHHEIGIVDDVNGANGRYGFFVDGEDNHQMKK